MDFNGTHDPVIYFARSDDGLIKIGFTTRLAARMSHIKSTSKRVMTLLATAPGSFDREQVIHAALRKFRHDGEWFRDDPGVVDFIAHNASPYEQRKRAVPVVPSIGPRVIVHTELHRALAHRRADSGKCVQDQVHEILCRTLNRADLLDSPLSRPAQPI